MLMQPRPSNRQNTTRRSFEAPNFVRERLLRARLRSLGEQRRVGAPRRFLRNMADAKSAADCVMAHPFCTRRGGEAARQYAAATTMNCKIWGRRPHFAASNYSSFLRAP